LALIGQSADTNSVSSMKIFTLSVVAAVPVVKWPRCTIQITVPALMSRRLMVREPVPSVPQIEVIGFGFVTVLVTEPTFVWANSLATLNMRT
jgi:hypothetical protein